MTVRSRGPFQPLVNFVVDFYLGTDGDVALHRDPIVDLVERSPAEGIRFVLVVTAFGAVFVTISCVPCLSYILTEWHRTGDCTKPLNWWLLAHCTLHLSQVFSRTIFSLRLLTCHYVHQLPLLTSVFELRRLTSARAWRLTRFVSFISVVWFLLGLIWIVNAKSTAALNDSSHIIEVSIVMVLASLVRLFVAVLLFHCIGPPRRVRFRVDLFSRKRGLPVDLIDTLPLVTFGKVKADDKLLKSDPLCAICLQVYEDDDVLRKLPCPHYFHKYCVDKWLQHVGTCPLCVSPVNISIGDENL
ncbi:MAG: uncharacterized protein KVP18_004806 [Porospora cf. gigantea A]|uniref:uncharacterized protein n=1 Tax=Porospora cf. gigantea A TaxID=2853593 RepID=UPI003559CBB9|nr:MAG: hypothetical protein KVP18_004806 [Porospora cf. gigantea A]